MTAADGRAKFAAVEIIAHRGASHDAPENTLAAVRQAWAQGADAVEIDVHLTRDGRLAVIHDPDTRRTAGAATRVSAATLEELQRLDVGAWKSAAFAGERVPALDEVLALVPAGRRIFVEVKGGPAALPALERALRASALAAGQVAVIAFDLQTAGGAKAALPRAEVCWIIEEDSNDGRLPKGEILARARAAQLDGLDLEATWVDAAWAQQTRAAGFKLYAWTVDDAPLARRLVQAGVGGITTNRPGWLRTALGL